jgi:uncharacterized protein (TIGR03905 family)
MKYTYNTKNTCSKQIKFDINDNVITNVEFLGGGCPGNLQALPRLVEGMTVEEINEKIGGIKCGFKPTSCADQLAQAITEAYEKITVK